MTSLERFGLSDRFCRVAGSLRFRELRCYAKPSLVLIRQLASSQVMDLVQPMSSVSICTSPRGFGPLEFAWVIFEEFYARNYSGPSADLQRPPIPPEGDAGPSQRKPSRADGQILVVLDIDGCFPEKICPVEVVLDGVNAIFRRAQERAVAEQDLFSWFLRRTPSEDVAEMCPAERVALRRALKAQDPAPVSVLLAGRTKDAELNTATVARLLPALSELMIRKVVLIR